MIADLFWNAATSTPGLVFDALVFFAALLVGYLPLLRFAPVLGAYVPLARLVAVFAALLLAFLIGFRLSDEREAAKNLRAELAIKEADLDNARKSATDEARRASEIEATASEQRKRDDDYIRHLEAKPACALGIDDLVWVPNYRAKSGRAGSARRPR